MHDIMILPFIQEHDYPEIKNIMRDDLPSIYSEWLDSHRSTKKFWAETKEIIEVVVNPVNFQSYLDDAFVPANGNTLLKYVEKISKER